MNWLRQRNSCTKSLLCECGAARDECCSWSERCFGATKSTMAIFLFLASPGSYMRLTEINNENNTHTALPDTTGCPVFVHLAREECTNACNTTHMKKERSKRLNKPGFVEMPWYFSDPCVQFGAHFRCQSISASRASRIAWIKENHRFWKKDIACRTQRRGTSRLKCGVGRELVEQCNVRIVNFSWSISI